MTAVCTNRWIRFETWSALLGLAVLLLAFSGCTYSNIDVGNGQDMSAKKAQAYAQAQYGGDLPVPIEDHPGRGRAVQPDRMITVDLGFTHTDGTPISNSRIRFVHSSRDTSLAKGYYTFGYVSPRLLAAMAGMQDGGSRRAQFTDPTCEDIYQSSFLAEFYHHQCKAFGMMRESPYGAVYGSIDYPRATPMILSISIVRVCRPWFLRENFPDLMGGGPHVKLIEMWCR